MKRIIALDPGGTTGWATFTLTEDAVHGAFDWGQMGPDEHHRELWNLLGMMHTEEYDIVCESFEYRNASRAGLVLVSKEYIGITKLFVEDRLATDSSGSLHVTYTEQTASKAKGFVKNSHLKRLGLWSSKHADRHAMDAMRHLIFYLVNSPEWKGSETAQKILEHGYKSD